MPRRDLFLNKLLERSDGLGQIVVGSEEVQQSHHLQRLDREFGGLEQFDGAARLFSSGQIADKHANATRIDHGGFFEVEQNLVLILGQQLAHGGVELVERRTHAKFSRELDDFHAVLRPRLDAQSAASPANCARASNCCPSLTLQDRFVRVRAQVR